MAIRLRVQVSYNNIAVIRLLVLQSQGMLDITDAAVHGFVRLGEVYPQYLHDLDGAGVAGGTHRRIMGGPCLHAAYGAADCLPLLGGKLLSIIEQDS